jgi:hypothetical protein
MIRLDSLDLTLDAGDMPTVSHDRLRGSETSDPITGEIRSTYTANGSQTGLHGFTGLLVTETGVSFRLNAQAMGDKYTDGISNGTLEELCDRLGSTGLVKVTPDQMRNGVVRRADPFADVYAADLEGIPEALRLIGRTSGDGTRAVGRGQAITLYHKLPDARGMLRTYDKGCQLGMAKQRAFIEAYPKVAVSLSGSRRSELQTQSYGASRRVAGMAKGTPTLADLLDSTRTPVSDALDAMLSTWTGRRRALLSLPSVPDSLDTMLSRPPAQFRDDAAAMLATLYAHLTLGDYEAATAAVRARHGYKNAARYFPLIRAACEAYGQSEDAEGSDSHAAAVVTLSALSARIREREGSTDEPASQLSETQS